MARKAQIYDDNVFINCPFDKKYKPILNAIVFAIHDAGFVARCSYEVIDSGQARLAKILSIIVDCKYGIHDISRAEIRRATDLPRFNMPFECGLFWGCLEFGGRRHRDKRILVFDSEEYRYRATLSDIAGQDIKIHSNDPRIAMDKVRTWLKAGSGRTTIPGGKAIWNHYMLFQKELPLMLKKARITRAELETPEYYPDYVEFVADWIRKREAKAAKRKARKPTSGVRRAS